MLLSGHLMNHSCYKKAPNKTHTHTYEEGKIVPKLHFLFCYVTAPSRSQTAGMWDGRGVQVLGWGGVEERRRRAGNEESMPGMSMFIQSSIQPVAAHRSSVGIKADPASAFNSERL